MKNGKSLFGALYFSGTIVLAQGQAPEVPLSHLGPLPRKVSNQIVRQYLRSGADQIMNIAVTVLNAANKDAQVWRPMEDPFVSWLPFTNPVTIDLDNKGDGIRYVWIGIRQENGESKWERMQVTVDTTPPTLGCLAPANGSIVAEPVVQIKGSTPDELANVECYVTSSAGNLKVSSAVLDREFDMSRHDCTNSVFQCFDVPLTLGVNKIILRLVDIVGNTSEFTLSYSYDPHSDPSPPQITLHWPTELDTVFSTTARLRGLLSKPTARINAMSGLGVVHQGIVERTGHFWIPNIPLNVGINIVNIEAVDLVGNSSLTAVKIFRSPVAISIDEPPDVEKQKKRPSITGRISHPGYTVFVNGVEAQSAGYYWKAEDVPVNDDTGTAIVQAVAIPKSKVATLKPGERIKPSLRDMGNPSSK